MIILTDDGTLDTVLYCSECGEEMRFSYYLASNQDPDSYDVHHGFFTTSAVEDQREYDAWVDDIIAEESEEHVCQL